MLKHICAYCMAAILLAGLLLGCANISADEPMQLDIADFQTGEHERDTVYAQTFTYRFVAVDGMTFCIEESLVGQVDASALFEIVYGDLKTIREGFERVESVQCYIVRKTLNQSVCATSGEIFCTPDDVTDGVYREGLVSATLDITEPWIAYGTYAWLFLEKTDDETMDDLAAYYTKEENLPALSLFAGYFNFTLAGRQSVRYAKQTAAAFASYLIEQYGTDALLSAGVSEEYRQAWLESIGVQNAYSAPCDISYLDGAQYSSTGRFPLVAIKDAHVFSFAFPQGIDSPLLVMQFLADYNAHIEQILSRIQADAPITYETVLANWNESLQIQITDLSNIYFAPDGYVYCDSSALAVRGTLENILKSELPEKLWLSQGLVFALPVITELKTGEWYPSFITDASALDDDIGTYLAAVQEYYLAHAAYPESEETFSDAAFFEAIAAVALLHPEYDLSTFAMGSWSVAAYRHGENAIDLYPGKGNQLTCLQAYQLTCYLIDEFGMETVLGYLYGEGSYEDAFQESFVQSYGKMLEALQQAQ